MSTDETPVPGLDDEREQLPPMPPGWMPATEDDVASLRRRIDTHWLPIMMDLTALDAAGALGGIRAVITERLREARAYATFGIQPSHESAIALAGLETEAGRYAQAAALLAAEIDRLAGGRS
jgi:hypothetical protein